MGRCLALLLVIEREGVGPITRLLEQLGREWDDTAPGSRIACNDLLRLTFIYVLHAFLAR